MIALSCLLFSCNGAILQEQYYNPATPPFSITQFPLISKAHFSDRNITTPVISFRVFDSAGKPLPNFTIKSLKAPYTVLANTSYYNTNDKGYVQVFFGGCDSLELANLTLLSGKKYRFGTRNLPDTITLVLTKSLADFWPSTR